MQDTIDIIKIAENDNVAVVTNEQGLFANTSVMDGLFTVEDIPFSQKISLEPIKKDEPILRYGVPIGYALHDIPQGSWVSEKSMYIFENPSLDETLLDSIPFEVDYRFENAQPVEQDYFWGYRNENGTVGTRNILAINITVQCVKGVVDRAIDEIKKELLPKYPNVDGVVQINHLYGCGVAINAKEAAIPQRTIRNIADNPNFGNEKLVVSLGCEKFIPENAFQVTADINPENLVVLQDCHGFQDMINKICDRADSMLQRLNTRTRERVPVSNLVVGLQCGGSDAFSGMTANPAIGYAADLLVQQGAKVMFSEVTEVRDATEIMLKRVRDKGTRIKLIQQLNWYDDYLKAGEVDRSANPSPGNKKGGLSTVVEKAMGSVAKSGTAEIVDVLAPGEKIKKSGMTFAATPASDFVCGTQQLASGMTVEVFSTGRGTPYNLEQCPVIKVATNSALYNKWFDIMDFDAGIISKGEATLEEAGRLLYEYILDVSSGNKTTCADKLQIYNDLAIFNPAQIT